MNPATSPARAPQLRPPATCSHLASAWLVILATLIGCTPNTAPPTNLILISLDTTRADRCSAYGYERDTTPNLSQLAAGGVRFGLAYSPTSTTGPTHASLFTSLYPIEHGVIRNGINLDDQFSTMAERLGELGYQTAGITSSFVFDAQFGYDQGFDFWDANFSWETSRVRLAEWEGHALKEGFDRPGQEVTNLGLTWLDELPDANRPFFLFLHYFDAHEPYDPPEPYRSRFAPHEDATEQGTLNSAYDASIAYQDFEMGRFLDGLEDRGLSENSIVVVLGDHGQGLMEHGIEYHGRTIYEEQVRVPLVIRWPGRILPGHQVDSPVALLDLMPTLFDLLSLESPGNDWRGQTLTSISHNKIEFHPSDRPVFLFRRHYAPAPKSAQSTNMQSVAGELYGIRRGRWKYIYGREEKRRELYDLDVDPNESHNRVSAEPRKTAELHAELEEWISSRRDTSDAAGELSNLDRARLQALGYTD